MTKENKTISAWFARRGGLFANLAWLGGIGFAAPAILAISTAPLWMTAAVLGAAAFPAVAGLSFAPRLDRAFERFAISLFWVALAAGAAAAGGGPLGPAAFAFLLAPALAAGFGARDTVINAGALSGLSALVVGALQIAGYLPAAPYALEIYTPFIPGAVATIAIGFSAGALRLMHAGDAARAEAERGRLRAAAFDAAPAALVACSEEGEMLAASSGLRILSPGLPRALDRLPFADLGFDEGDRDQLLTAGKFAARRPVSDTLTLRGPRGQALPVKYAAAPIEGGSVAVFSQDIGNQLHTSLREACIERDRAKEEARAKSQFLASVSHELRTPLNAIVGFSDVMKARLFGPLPARYAEYAELIHESGQQLMELIGDVLDMSKIEADRYELERETFDVSEIVAICVKLMRLQAEEAGLNLSVEAPDGPLEVNADRKAMRQILLNLLSNAVKFTPSGGAVVVMVRATGENLVLAVGDSGVGIAEEDLDRLGQPYQQAGSARESDQRGTGLGLSLVRALAELHGGSVAIASRKGEGTTVTLTLPVLTEVRGEVDHHPRLEIHDQIARAQAVGERLASASPGLK